MELGAITGYIDVAQIVLYLFWIFFACLIIYLQFESRREGYPLDDGRFGYRGALFFPSLPEKKTFIMPDGSKRVVPEGPDERPIAAKPTGPDIDMPIEPTGNPMVDGVGPAAWAEREDVPDMTSHGAPRIAPMRVATDFFVIEGNTDPRGMKVVAADEQEAGTIADIWVDQAESLIRYLEVELSGGGRRLLPMTLARVEKSKGRVAVKSILSTQFDTVPTTKNPEQVTLLEEDKIQAYYTGGHFYATPQRNWPLV
jgi:photosynthetic reaction center H subunit